MILFKDILYLIFFTFVLTCLFFGFLEGIWDSRKSIRLYYIFSPGYFFGMILGKLLMFISELVSFKLW